MITGKDILIISTQDWDALPTRKHHWARKLASRGNRVVYVEQQMHILGWLADIGNQYKRLWSWMNGPRIVSEGLWTYTLPIVLPFLRRGEKRFFCAPFFAHCAKNRCAKNFWGPMRKKRNAEKSIVKLFIIRK